MQAVYKATYRDAHSQETTEIRNDGEMLEMTVRGVTFMGNLDNFKPVISPGDPALSSFTLDRYSDGSVELCGYVLEFEMPLPVNTPDGIAEGTLTVHRELGFPNERGLFDREIVALRLNFAGVVYRSPGRHECFENELLGIQQMLPEGVFMRACINCAFSDYNVAGNGPFGYMMCFRGSKEAYLGVRGKDEYIDIMDERTSFVQETYLCDEFDRRKPGTGYRG
jgi:hypothetical protein